MSPLVTESGCSLQLMFGGGRKENPWGERWNFRKRRWNFFTFALNALTIQSMSTVIILFATELES